MTTPTIERIVPCQCALGEGVLWHPDEEAVYWVDLLVGRVHRYHPATAQHDRYDFALPVTALGLRAAGGFVVATRDGFACWQPPQTTLTFLIDPEAHRPQARFNDGAVAPGGQFFAGTMTPDSADNALYRLDADGTAHQVETGLTISNGLDWSPDGRTLYFTDSSRRVIYAYNYEADSGAISNRRVFVATPDDPGVPDGLAVDAAGYVWSARYLGGTITRYAPDGAVDRVLEVPVACPTRVAFGGPDLHDLYITSAWQALDAAGRAAQPWSGDLLRVRVDAAGQPPHRYAG